MSLSAPAGNQPENRVRKKRRHRGSQISEKLVRPLFSRKAFILLVIHRDQWIIQSHAGSAALTLIETRLSLCIPNCIHRSQVIYIIFWPGGLLAFYGPFLIRVHQPENLFALKVLFLLKSGATLRKH